MGGWDDRDDMLNYLLSLRLRAPEPDDTPRDDSIRWIAGFRERQQARREIGVFGPVTKRMIWREMPVQHITAATAMTT